LQARKILAQKCHPLIQKSRLSLGQKMGKWRKLEKERGWQTWFTAPTLFEVISGDSDTIWSISEGYTLRWCTWNLGRRAWVGRTDVDGAGDWERGEGAVDVDWGNLAGSEILGAVAVETLKFARSAKKNDSEWEKERNEEKKTYDLLQFLLVVSESLWIGRQKWPARLQQARMKLEDAADARDSEPARRNVRPWAVVSGSWVELVRSRLWRFEPFRTILEPFWTWVKPWLNGTENKVQFSSATTWLTGFRFRNRTGGNTS
jgi:hypothetical protein